MGGPESLKSAILDGKQLFLLNQVIGRSGELKIGYFRWKRLCLFNQLFKRCRESRKSAILNGKQLFLLYEGFRSIELKIDSFRLKTAVYMKSGVFRNFPVVWAKSWFVPFAKNPEWRLFEKDIFIARKGLFDIKNIAKHHFKAYFEEKWREEFSSFGTKVMG